MDRGAWWVTVHKVSNSQDWHELAHTHARAHTHTHIYTLGFPHTRLKICLQWRRPRRRLPGSGRSSWERIGYPLQYSWASLVVQLVKNLPAMWETWVRSLGWKDPLERISLHFHTLVKHFHLKFSDQMDELKWPNGWAENVKHTLHLKT